MDKKVFLIDKEVYNENEVMRFTEDTLEDLVSNDNDYSDSPIIKLDANLYATPEDAIDCEGFDPDSYYVLSFGFSDDDSITRQDVLDLFADSGWNLFGKWVDEVADAIADEVVEEYNEAGDGNLQKSISYVILDKWDKLG
jgi:hypothetical protein